MLFVTREHIHVDRIATAWAIRRLVDPEARFRVVPRSSEPPAEGFTRGLRAIANGSKYLHGKEDHKRIELETPMYDALYAFFEHEVAQSSSS